MERKHSPQISAEMAAHIRFLIEDRGLFQHQAAALIGVNQGRISEVMRGQIHPTVKPAQGSVVGQFEISRVVPQGTIGFAVPDVLNVLCLAAQALTLPQRQLSNALCQIRKIFRGHATQTNWPN